MDFQIRELTPKLLEDYLYFFDHAIFEEHPHWSKCYCYSFHFTGPAEEWIRERNRESVIEMINSGDMKGYLAYEGDQPVGWCNANDRQNYSSLQKHYDLPDPAHGLTASVVCFLIRPEYRRMGLARKLLERVIKDYSSRDYVYLEAYPSKRRVSCEGQYPGPLTLYETAGFTILHETDDYYIARKKIG